VKRRKYTEEKEQEVLKLYRKVGSPKRVAELTEMPLLRAFRVILKYFILEI